MAAIGAEVGRIRRQLGVAEDLLGEITVESEGMSSSELVDVQLVELRRQEGAELRNFREHQEVKARYPTDCGQSSLAQWVEDGTLLPSAAFAAAWGLTRQALDQAVERNDLFSVKLGNKRYFLGALVPLDRSAVAMVCRALGSAVASEKLLFWLRKQGALGGKTVADIVAAGGHLRAAEVARDWAEERGLAE